MAVPESRHITKQRRRPRPRRGPPSTSGWSAQFSGEAEGSPATAGIKSRSLLGYWRPDDRAFELRASQVQFSTARGGRH